MSKQEERKKQIRQNIIDNAEYLASNLVQNKDLELRCCKDGIVIYLVSKKKIQY